jgi:hypothetical protein
MLAEFAEKPAEKKKKKIKSKIKTRKPNTHIFDSPNHNFGI